MFTSATLHLAMRLPAEVAPMCRMQPIFVVAVGVSALAVNAHAQQTVVWTGVINATVSGNSISKNGGCDGCQDAGGISQRQIASGTGAVQFDAAAGGQVFVGLSHVTATPLQHTQIDYAFAIAGTGGCDIREFGTWKTDAFCATGDHLMIAIEAGPVVKFYRNGTVVYTSATVPASYPYVLGADLLNTASTVQNAQITTSALTNWTSQDLGAVGTAGSASQSGNTFTVRGAGADIWGTTDAFQFVYQTLTGDGQIVARVDTVQNTNAKAKGGVMLRDGLAADAAHVIMDIKPTGGTELLQRATRGAITTKIAGPTVSFPYWVRLTRAGSTISGWVAPDGVAWSLVGSVTANLSATLNTGVAVTSLDVNQLNTSVFESVAISSGTAVPTTYSANTSRDTLQRPGLPTLGPAGFRFTDPTFGSRIVRVTDENTRPGAPGRSYTAPSSTTTMAWNAASDKFWVRGKDGTFIPYNFDASTMTATRIQPSGSGNGGLTIVSQSELQFSYVSPNIVFGSRQDPTNDWPIIRQFDFNTFTYTDLLNLGTLTSIGHSTYVGALSSSAAAPERLCVIFGATQDSNYKIVVFQPGAPASAAIVLDSMASTITINGTTTATNIPLGVHLHSGYIDQSGRYVLFTPTNAQPVPIYIWDLTTNTLRTLNADGHNVAGYGVWINKACCATTTWDGVQWEFRSLAAPDTFVDLINPVLTPQELYVDDHTSWNNAQPGTLVPMLSSLYRYYDGTLNTTPWRAWDGEIVAVQTSAQGSGNATVWRFAHNRSDAAWDGDPNRKYFWYTPNAVISPNGRWAIFASNWEKTLGPAADAEPGGGSRVDVLLLELR
jgi:hypothetical protein